MTNSVDTILQAAEYKITGHNEAGIRYTRGEYTIYHSGYMLVVIRKGGMTRSFSEDRLRYFSVSDLERQVSMLPSGMFYREEKNNYDIPKRI